jgi:hypothetical protein
VACLADRGRGAGRSRRRRRRCRFSRCRRRPATAGNLHSPWFSPHRGYSPLREWLQDGRSAGHGSGSCSHPCRRPPPGRYRPRYHADWPVAMPDTEHHQGGRPGVFHQVGGRGDVVIFPTVAAEGRVMSATVAGARAGRRDGPWAEPSGVLGSSGGPSAEPSALAEPAREHPPAAALIAGTAFASGRAPCH